MECGGPGKKALQRKRGVPEVTITEGPGAMGHPPPSTAGPFGLGKSHR